VTRARLPKLAFQRRLDGLRETGLALHVAFRRLTFGPKYISRSRRRCTTHRPFSSQGRNRSQLAFPQINSIALAVAKVSAEKLLPRPVRFRFRICGFPTCCSFNVICALDLGQNHSLSALNASSMSSPSCNSWRR
jgi:hypothetical protein